MFLKNNLFNFYDSYLEPICDGCPHLMGLLCYQDSTFNLHQPDTAKGCDYTWVDDIPQFEKSTKQLAVYPNPSLNTIHIKSTIDFTKVEAINILGELIELKTISKINEQETTLDISKLPTGQYLLHLSTKNEIVGMTKIIKQ